MIEVEGEICLTTTEMQNWVDRCWMTIRRWRTFYDPPIPYKLVGRYYVFPIEGSRQWIIDVLGWDPEYPSDYEPEEEE